MVLYVPKVQMDADRLEKLKRVLEDKNIPLKKNWQTIDRDCRNKLN